VVNDLTPTRKASGDALSELQKLREMRQKQTSSKPKRFVSSQYPSHPSTSPTTMSESSLPTPTTDTRTRGVRCVCNRAEAGLNDLLIQWCVSHGSPRALTFSRPNIFQACMLKDSHQ
jgi:hypothetical protein